MIHILLMQEYHAVPVINIDCSQRIKAKADDSPSETGNTNVSTRGVFFQSVCSRNIFAIVLNEHASFKIDVVQFLE